MIFESIATPTRTQPSPLSHNEKRVGTGVIRPTNILQQLSAKTVDRAASTLQGHTEPNASSAAHNQRKDESIGQATGARRRAMQGVLRRRLSGRPVDKSPQSSKHGVVSVIAPGALFPATTVADGIVVEERAQTTGECQQSDSPAHLFVLQTAPVKRALQVWEGTRRTGSMLPGHLSVLGSVPSMRYARACLPPPRRHCAALSIRHI